jgi:phytoene synthase
MPNSVECGVSRRGCGVGEGGGGRSAVPDWELCRRVVREHGKTFYFASQFLPPERRRAIHAAYAFCRIADDIVDRATATGLAVAARALDAWEAELDAPVHQSPSPSPPRAARTRSPTRPRAT